MFYNQYGQLVWACRDIATGQFSYEYTCSGKAKPDYRWPGHEMDPMRRILQSISLLPQRLDKAGEEKNHDSWRGRDHRHISGGHIPVAAVAMCFENRIIGIMELAFLLIQCVPACRPTLFVAGSTPLLTVKEPRLTADQSTELLLT
ncbi:MAG: hypothetical protein ACRECY_05275 [Phyllobacterium sp.]